MRTEQTIKSLKWATLLLAAGLVFLGSMSVQRRVADFQPVGFTATTDGATWRVAGVSDASTGLRAGDLILDANGAGPAEQPHLASILRGQAESVLAVQRGADFVLVEYTLPPLEIDWAYVILCLIGIGYLIVGLYTILREPRLSAFLFALWCLAATTVYLFSAVAPFDNVGRVIYLVEEVARVLLAPLTLHLFWIFPTPVSRRRLAAVVPFFYLPAAFIFALQANLIFFGGSWFAGASRLAIPTIDRLVLAQLGGYSILAMTLLAWRLLTTRRSDHRRQVAWMVVGLTLGYLPFLLLYAVPHTLGFSLSPLLTSAAVLPLALVPLTFAYAILRYKLWDIGGMVRDGISLSLTALIGVLGFSLVNLALHRTVPEDLALARDVLTFVTGLVIAGVVLPANRRIGDSLQRLQYGNRFLKRRALVDFGDELLHERDLDRLSKHLIERLEEGLEIESAALFVAHGDSLYLTAPRDGANETEPIPLQVIPGELWREDVTPLSGVDFPSDRPALLQHFFVDGFRYLFPMTAQSQPVGLLAVGYKEGDVPLSSDDLGLLRQLLNQAALSLENAKLLHRVTEQLHEVTRLQEYSRGIIESSPVGIAVLDPEARVVTANRAFEAIVGASLETLPGSKLAEHLPILPLPSPEEGVRELSFCSGACEIGADGENPDARPERHLEVSTSEYLSPEGPQTVLVVRDVTDEVALEAEMKEKERLASLGMLAAGVAHEVNTPITGISSYAQMLMADTDPEDPAYATLQKVEKQTFRASRIVNSLLDFARKRSEVDRVALVPLLEEVFELTTDRMARHGVELDWVRPQTGGEEILLEADDGEIQQVATNLVMNAIDAMRSQGGGTIRVRVEADSSRALVHVRDTGPGISTEALGQIFRPFYSTKRGEGGTGLGLSISYNIVERHGGELRVASPPGEGAHFTIDLPRIVEGQRLESQIVEEPRDQ